MRLSRAFGSVLAGAFGAKAFSIVRSFQTASEVSSERYLDEFDFITLVVFLCLSTAVARRSNRVHQILAYAFILGKPLHMQSYSQLALRENRQ